ncbi:MAG: hypothetical protein H7332_13685 [Bdellovibrionales bacterium]|nr:hypothetical protein [Ramlibacter sp.]
MTREADGPLPAADALPEGRVLFDGVHAKRGGGIVFDSWHGNVHMPALRAALRSGKEARYVSAVRGSMISIFELAPSDDAQAALRLSVEPPETVDWLERFIAVPSTVHRRPDANETGQPGRAPIAYPVFFAVPPEGEYEFDHWYDDEHMPILLGCKAWLGCRRFRLPGTHPQGWTHMALHDLADVSAIASPEREAARATAWRERLSANGWFKGDYRVLYKLA